jgi:hypothetical protein
VVEAIRAVSRFVIFPRRPADETPPDIADLCRRRISQFEMFLLP